MQGDVQTAILLALRAHLEQKDKAGQPYIMHVLRVGAAGENEAEQIVGFLHDTIEDTRDKKEGFVVSAQDLLSYFNQDIVAAVVAITRQHGESYPAYIARVAQNDIARAVKINDLKDNINRLYLLPPREADGLGRRYRAALSRLRQTIIDESKPRS